MQGFNALLGFRRTEWRDGYARLELDIAPQHLNRSGILHGGVLAAMLDATLGFTGVYSDEPGQRRRAVTLSMTTLYIGQARSGTIACRAERTGGGRSVFMATGTVTGPDGALLATGQGVFRHIADAAPAT
jgi:uncharacterized protein (TIGR00369 family)